MKLTTAREPKIILWDIETSLMTVTTFSLRPDYIPHAGILQDWSILCGSWKELGKDEIHSVSVTKVGNDKTVVKKLRDVLVDADVVVAHNGDKFDIKKLNSRLIFHGLDPLPSLLTVDTLKEVKKIGYFTSNRLDYLGKHLLGEGKLHTSDDLWMRVLKNDKEALKEMVVYNKADVVLLEKVYLKLRPYMKKHPHVGVLSGEHKDISCNNCGSLDLKRRGQRLTASGVVKQEYQCKQCGKYHTTALDK